jgi:hypothetical protein
LFHSAMLDVFCGDVGNDVVHAVIPPMWMLLCMVVALVAVVR